MCVACELTGDASQASTAATTMAVAFSPVAATILYRVRASISFTQAASAQHASLRMSMLTVFYSLLGNIVLELGVVIAFLLPWYIWPQAIQLGYITLIMLVIAISIHIRLAHAYKPVPWSRIFTIAGIAAAFFGVAFFCIYHLVQNRAQFNWDAWFYTWLSESALMHVGFLGILLITALPLLLRIPFHKQRIAKKKK